MTPRLPGPLPLELPDTFTVDAARAADVSAERLRSRDLDARVYGVRAPAGSADDLLRRARMFAARLPELAFFSHSTAALLVGCPLPPRFERMTRLHVTVEAPRRAPHAAGILGHSRYIAKGDIVTFGGTVRVSSPERIVCEMAAVLAIPDLVAVIDHLIRRREPATAIASLVERLAVGDRIARSPRLRRALELADDRAESAPESRLRAMCVLAGLPRPDANYELTDPWTGRALRLDLAWPDHRFAIEYHGDYHRNPAQWQRDVTRRSKVEALGWRVLELTAADLRDEAELLARIREGLGGRSR